MVFPTGPSLLLKAFPSNDAIGTGVRSSASE
jgi:hypothetical protein